MRGPGADPGLLGGGGGGVWVIIYVVSNKMACGQFWKSFLKELMIILFCKEITK